MSKFYESKAPVTAPTASPATEYYDPINATHDSERNEKPQISIREPTPSYEPHPSFPQPHLANEKGDLVGYGYGTGTAKANGIRTPQQGVSPASSKHVSINDDIVLAPNAQADVKRGGTWAHGPGTSGPREPGLKRGQSLAERATMASKNIPEKERVALSKAEIKDAKRLSKIIKAEGKAEDKQLKGGLKELDSLQRAQKKASAAETQAVTDHSRAAKEQHRASAAYLEAKTRFERAQSNLKVTEERLTMAKEHAEKMTELVRRQAQEVETLRERKATDDRERAVKLANLKAGMMSPTEY